MKKFILWAPLSIIAVVMTSMMTSCRQSKTPNLPVEGKVIEKTVSADINRVDGHDSITGEIYTIRFDDGSRSFFDDPIHLERVSNTAWTSIQLGQKVSFPSR